MNRKNPLTIACLPAVLIIWVTVFILSGCSGQGAKNENVYLIRVGESIVTVGDYDKAFEIAKIAYPYNIEEDADELDAVRIRVLNQMSEELVLIARARDLGISVSEQELENAVSAIKKDYPEGGFEQALLESAIPYESWKKRLATRILTKKVIEAEIDGKISITPDDISAYYEKHYQYETKLPENINEIIVNDLRREKKEELYTSWIKDVKSKYRIEINEQEWKKINTRPAGSQTGDS